MNSKINRQLLVCQLMNPNLFSMKNLKYIALGILVGYLLPYIYTLTQNPQESEVKISKEKAN